jgi:hypothetical protein
MLSYEVMGLLFVLLFFQVINQKNTSFDNSGIASGDSCPESTSI